MAIDWTPARLEVDLNYKSKDIVLASEWNNLWKETRLQGNNNTDGIVLLIETVEGNTVHLTNLDNLFADLESKVTAHTGNSDIHVTSIQKTAWTAKYDKPSVGIPKSDLASSVQTSLEKADSALQQHQDISALTAHVANNNVHVTSEQKTAWSAKYNKPTDGIPKTDLAGSVQSSLNKADTALQEHQDISDLRNHVSNSGIHVTSDNKNAWNAKYDKPTGGIPKTDLASAVQTSLNKADSALQEHQDISDLVSHTQNSNIHVTSEQKTAWSAKYDKPTGGIPKTDLASDVQTSLVPASSSSDAGKMLSVDGSGNPAWTEASSSGTGGKSAYAYAVEGGYALTESDFTTDLGNLHNLPTHISNINIHIDSAERTAWNAKYEKPSSGIPKTDLASAVQSSLVPSSLSSDSGKVLTVSSSGDAVWAEATSSGADVFNVAFTQDEVTGGFTADKTYAEVVAAHEAGKIVRCSAGGILFGQLVNLVPPFNTVWFRVESYTDPTFNGGFIVFTINSANEVNHRTIQHYSSSFSQYTILASGWSSGVYSFELDFPSETYDIEIELDSTATESQVGAWSSAKVTAVFGTNTMKALGDVPAVDIPVIVKKVVK